MALTAGDPLWYYKVLGLHCDGANNSTTFTDVKGKTVTANGDAKVSTAQYPALTGKTSSAYFDGTGDYLSIPASADFNFGTGDFTVRCRFYLAGNSATDAGGMRNATLFRLTDTTTGFAFQFGIDGSAATTGTGITLYSTANGSLSRTVSVSQSAWHDIEVSRAGTSLRIFLDGTQLGATFTNSASWGSSTQGAYVGGSPYSSNYYQYFNGYIAEVEIYKGGALHTSDFTPSSDPFPDTYLRISGTTKDAGGNFASRLVRVYRRDTGDLVAQVVSNATTGEYVVTAPNSGSATPLKHVAYMHTTENGAHVPWRVLGLHCDGANTSTTFTDVKGKTVTAVGNAQISTAQYPSLTGKTSSGYVDGTGDYLTIPDSADWDFGVGAFTVRIRARFSGVTTEQALVSNYLNSSTGFSLVFDGVNSKLKFLNGTTALLDVAWSPSTNTWYDIEVSRYGTSLRGFVDGTQVGATATNSTNITGSTSTLFIGARDSTNQLFTGYFSEVEIYNGAAVHTEAFTPLTVSFYDAIGTATDNAVIFDDITPY